MRVQFHTNNLAELTKEYMVVDMHFHSKYSPDSSTSIESILKKAKELDVYVVLTDHNSIRGVMKAHEIEPGRILPGIEVTTKENKDILLYFPTVESLSEFFEIHIKPYVKNKSSLRVGKTDVRMEHIISAAKMAGALVVVAHPFAVRPRKSYNFFAKRQDLMENVDAIEVANQALPHKGNLLAIGWSTEENLPMVSGSDGHIVKMLGTAFTCCKADSWEGFLNECRKGRTLVIGEKRKLRHHVVNMARIIREKGRVIQNRRIRNGKD